MADLTFDAWRKGLDTLRAEWHDASQRFQGPYVCWFYFQYPEPPTHDTTQDAMTFAKAIAHSRADVACFLNEYQGERRLYWSVLFDGEQAAIDLFKRLASQSYGYALNWPRPWEQELSKIMPDWSIHRGHIYTDGDPRHMDWVAFAANIRRAVPDARLGVSVSWRNKPGGSWRGEEYIPPAVFYQTKVGGRSPWPLRMPKVEDSYQLFDGSILPAPINYQGPGVVYWTFVHDVWRVSVAAMDIILTKIDECARSKKANLTTAEPPPSPETLMPHWNDDLRELSFGGTVCKRFRQPAQHQTRILKEFQEAGWPPKVDDPLPYTSENKRHDRLTNAVKKLNQQELPLLRFELDGTGQGILWKPAAPHSA
jgi:hypothetical protein